MGKEIYNDGKYRAVVVCGWNDTEKETKESIRLAQIKQREAEQALRTHQKKEVGSNA